MFLATFSLGGGGSGRLQVLERGRPSRGVGADGQLPVEDVLAVEHDVIPLYGADISSREGAW